MRAEGSGVGDASRGGLGAEGLALGRLGVREVEEELVLVGAELVRVRRLACPTVSLDPGAAGLRRTFLGRPPRSPKAT